jgi:hypothetical protein
MSQYWPQAVVIFRAVFENKNLTIEQQKQIQAYLQSGGQIVLGQPIPNITADPAYDMNIQCQKVRVNINDYTVADTFSLEVDYKNFPLDPRTLKSLGVSIYIQDVGELFRPPPNNALHKIHPSEDNVVLEGFVDTDTIDFDDTNRVIKMEGRDLTGLFLDTPWNLAPVPLSTPLDQLFSQIVKSLINTQKIEVINNSGVNPLPTLGALGPEFSSLANLKNVKKDESYWETMQDLASRAGLIIHMNIDKLIITKPRNLYTADPTKIVHMIYGQNLKSLEFKRKLGRLKGFNVIVRSFDDKTVNVAKIPEESTPDWAAATGVTLKRVQIPQFNASGAPQAPQDAPFFSFKVPNIADKSHLILVGEKIFEEISRQQIDGQFKTKEMLAPTQDQIGTTFDLTKLDIGTPVKIEIDQDDLRELNRLTAIEDKVHYLIIRGYPPTMARVFAETMSKFHTTFYTKSFEMSIDNEQGWDLKVDFVNFIEDINVILGNG